MCKVLGFSNTSKIKKSIPNFVNLCLAAVKQRERDGLGYELVTSTGRFGEKMIGSKLQYGMTFRKTAPIVKKPSGEYWGKVPLCLTGAAIFHSRTSTNAISTKNTHPLRRDGISVIHNGVVTNVGKLKFKPRTSNDTENILEYLCQTSPSVLAASLTGYYAVLYLDRDNTLGVIRDSVADLVAVYHESIASWIFATNEEIIRDVESGLGLPKAVLEEVQNDLAFKVNTSNEFLDLTEIKSLGYGIKEAKFSQSSLGYTLGNTGNTKQNEIDLDWSTYRYQDYSEPKPHDSENEKAFIRFVENIQRSNLEGYSLWDNRGDEIPLDMVQALTDEEVLSLTVLDDSTGEEYTLETFLDDSEAIA